MPSSSSLRRSAARPAGGARSARSGPARPLLEHAPRGTYFMSSCSAWPRMRMVSASISVGPVARARPLDGPAGRLVHGEHVVAVDAARRRSRRPAARSTMRVFAVCRGWASSTPTCCSRRSRTSGAFCTQAKLKPSWKAPVEVPPSPIQVSATVLPALHALGDAPRRPGSGPCRRASRSRRSCCPRRRASRSGC